MKITDLEYYPAAAGLLRIVTDDGPDGVCFGVGRVLGRVLSCVAVVYLACGLAFGAREAGRAVAAVGRARLVVPRRGVAERVGHPSRKYRKST